MLFAYLGCHAGDAGLQRVTEALLVDVPHSPRAQSAVAEGTLDDTALLLPLDEALDVEGLIAGCTWDEEVLGFGVATQGALAGDFFFEGCCRFGELGVLATMDAIDTCTVATLLSVAVGALEDGTAPREVAMVVLANGGRQQGGLHGCTVHTKGMDAVAEGVLALRGGGV